MVDLGELSKDVCVDCGASPSHCKCDTQDLYITTDTYTQEFTTYRWYCPDCGDKRQSSNRPEDHGDALCHTCREIHKGKLYTEHFKSILGASVVDITRPDESRDYEYVKRLWLKDAEGNLWLVTSDMLLYVYEVDVNGKPK